MSKGIAIYTPVLIVPLAEGLTQHRDDVQLEGPFPDGASVAEDLVLDGAGQGRSAVLGAGAFATIWQRVAVEGLDQHVDGADVLLAVRAQEGRLLWCRVEPHRHRGHELARRHLTSWIAFRGTAGWSPGSHCPLSGGRTSGSTVKAVCADAGTPRARGASCAP